MRGRSDTASPSSGDAMKMRVVRATNELLASRPFDDITVRTVCDAAGIARSSFYYHFEDKFDIVQWHYEHVAERNLFQVGRTLNWKQAAYRNTREVSKVKDLYIGSFAARGYQSLFSYSKRRRAETLAETIVEYKGVQLDDALEMQVFAFAESEVACMSRWCKQGMPYSVEHLVDCLMGIVPKRLYDLLDDPVDPEYY